MLDFLFQALGFVSSPSALYLALALAALVAASSFVPVLAPLGELLKPILARAGQFAVQVFDAFCDGVQGAWARPSVILLIVAASLGAGTYARAQVAPKVREANAKLEKCLAHASKPAPAARRPAKTAPRAQTQPPAPSPWPLTGWPFAG